MSVAIFSIRAAAAAMAASRESTSIRAPASVDSAACFCASCWARAASADCRCACASTSAPAAASLAARCWARAASAVSTRDRSSSSFWRAIRSLAISICVRVSSFRLRSSSLSRWAIAASLRLRSLWRWAIAASVAPYVALPLRDGRRRAPELALALGDGGHRTPPLDARLDGEGLRLAEPRLEIPHVHPGERLPGLDHVALGDQHGGDAPRALGRDVVLGGLEPAVAGREAGRQGRPSEEADDLRHGARPLHEIGPPRPAAEGGEQHGSGDGDPPDRMSGNGVGDLDPHVARDTALVPSIPGLTGPWARE